MKQPIVPVFAGLALAAGSTNAAVIYGGSFQSWQTRTTSNTDNVTVVGSGFDASGFDKLVVIATTENGNPGSPAGRIDTVTYDGVPLTLAVASLPIAADPGVGIPFNQNFTSIWYLDNPPTTAGVIATTGNSRIVATAFGLNGTAAGFGNTAEIKDPTQGSGGYSVSLASATDSLVVSAIGLGGNGNTGAAGGVDPISGTEIDGLNVASNWVGHVAAYGPGNGGTYGFTDSSPTGDVSTIAVEFTAIPEPSAVALLGVASLGLFGRRRR